MRPAPAARRYEGWSFRSFAEGAEAFRALEQAARRRTSRGSPTRRRRGCRWRWRRRRGGTAERLGRRYLRLRGHERRLHRDHGFEGSADDGRAPPAATSQLLRAGGGVALGQRPGRSWLRGRYAAPYLRDELLDRGVMVETLETATTWSNLATLHAAVRSALRERAGGARDAGRGDVPRLAPLPLRRVALLHLPGPPAAGRRLDQWRAAKDAACEAIVEHGGTITHHHAVGRDHAPWMRAEVGELGLELLRAAKQRLDPAGIMNPGKLLPPA